MRALSFHALRLCLACAVLMLVFGATARANAPPGRYTSSGGTVTDTKTKLIWQQVTPTAAFLLADAKAYCASAAGATLGGSGWRLPTIKELLSLLDYTQTVVLIDQNFFSVVTSVKVFWSSTPTSSGFVGVWGLNFSNGFNFPLSVDETGVSVRCVR
jgi:hypothetical protein